MPIKHSYYKLTSFLVILLAVLFLSGCIDLSCKEKITTTPTEKQESQIKPPIKSAECRDKAGIKWAIKGIRSALNKLNASAPNADPVETLKIGTESIRTADFDPSPSRVRPPQQTSEIEAALNAAMNIPNWMDAWQKEATEIHENVHRYNFKKNVESYGWGSALKEFNKNSVARKDEIEAYSKELDALQKTLDYLEDIKCKDEKSYITEPCTCNIAQGYAIGTACGATLKYPGGNCNSCLCKIGVDENGTVIAEEIYYKCCLECPSEVENFQKCGEFESKFTP